MAGRRYCVDQGSGILNPHFKPLVDRVGAIHDASQVYLRIHRVAKHDKVAAHRLRLASDQNADLQGRSLLVFRNRDSDVTFRWGFRAALGVSKRHRQITSQLSTGITDRRIAGTLPGRRGRSRLSRPYSIARSPAVKPRIGIRICASFVASPQDRNRVARQRACGMDGANHR